MQIAKAHTRLHNKYIVNSYFSTCMYYSVIDFTTTKHEAFFFEYALVQSSPKF